MAVYANLTVDQGTDFSSAIDVTDSDGDPVSLVGYTVAGQIRKHYNSSTKVDFVATVSNATAGIVSLSLSDDEEASYSDPSLPTSLTIRFSGIGRLIKNKFSLLC